MCVFVYNTYIERTQTHTLGSRALSLAYLSLSLSLSLSLCLSLILSFSVCLSVLRFSAQQTLSSQKEPGNTKDKKKELLDMLDQAGL